MDVGSGGGVVKLDSVELPYFPYTLEVGSGTTVTVEAVPDFGYVFSHWSGDLNAPADTATLTIDCDKQISAIFSLNWKLIGFAGGSLLLAILLGTVLIIRRK